jgi:hypothetical protein
MSAVDLLKEFKSKVEIRAQIEESDLSVTVIDSNPKESKAIVSEAIEGHIKRFEVIFRLMDSNTILDL